MSEDVLQPTPVVARPRSDYAALLAEVKAAGLLARRPGGYAVRAAVVAVVLVGSWVAFALLGASWWQVAVAAVLAVVSTQVAFLGHDAGHQQVFASRRRNDRLGLVMGNLVVGLSYGWWIDKHVRHHAHPNLVGYDPDISESAVSFTPDQTRARTTRSGRWLARHQAVAFFPMLLLEGIALRVAGAVSLWHSPPGRPRTVEALLLGTHVVGYLAAVFLVLPPLPALGFIALHQGLFGLYMGCSFAPTHKGMPLISRADELDFLRRQVLTSRNIRGGPALDMAMGGLNHQIEHHLFPSMPSANLRRARPIVARFCRDHGIAYSETSLATSYGLVLRYLHDVGSVAPVRP